MIRCLLPLLLLGACSRDGLQVTPDAFDEPRDMTVADLVDTTCARAGADQTAWVDPVLGHDDDAHGASLGACGFKTISYAVAHATGRINLRSGMTYQAPEETFPLVLDGTQVLDCDPAGSGAPGRISGLGQVGDKYGVVFLSGRANQVLSCDLRVPSRTGGPNINACVQITTSGAHVVDGCELHECGAGVYNVGVYLNNTDGASITNTRISDVQNCTNSLGNNVTVRSTYCSAIGYLVSLCGSVTGCGNTNASGGLGLCTGCDCGATLTTDCP